MVDPSTGVDALLDVAVQAGKIAALAPNLQGAQAIDVTGQYVCPGLVDLHGHWYEASSFGIDPNICLNHGVTTVVDAGTAGFINFPQFRRHTMDPARIGVLAFIHIGCIGIPTTIVGELEDLRYARPIETAEMIAQNLDVAVGVKLRAGSMTQQHGVEALEKALDACQRAKARLMVHISRMAPTREILRRLRPGDIVTHCFEGRGDGLFHENRELLPEATDARRQGVVFDVGHGAGSFSWEVARRAFEYHFWPDTISTDLHRYSIDRFTIDLPTTMSKFLHLGMPLADVILKSTWVPAQAIGRDDLGTLKPGSPADVLVFTIEDGEFDFEDTHLRIEKGRRRITPRLVLRKGEPIEPGSQPICLRPLYPYDQDVFDTIEQTK